MIGEGEFSLSVRPPGEYGTIISGGNPILNIAYDKKKGKSGKNELT